MILSRGRSKTISTTNLLPEWVEVLVPESEKKLYQDEIKNPILTCPDIVQGLGELRNWVLDNFCEETVVMIDDDIYAFYCLTKEKTIRCDKYEMVQVIINTAVMAKDAGAKVFGFSQSDIRKYKGYDPFAMCSWVGTIIGVIGRKYRFRKDKFKVDIDFCLQNLLVDRFVWVNTMYLVANAKDNNVGGNSLFRTNDAFNKSVETLAKKWGDCLRISEYQNQKSIKINFVRRQRLKYE